jgi:membrane protein YdbS with pleckstrin-like domain
VTGEAVYTLSGWIVREWRIAPISRVQTVDTEHGPLQQLLGLASVTVTTASARGPVTIRGLAAGDAAELARQLTETTQATAGDAT